MSWQIVVRLTGPEPDLALRDKLEHWAAQVNAELDRQIHIRLGWTETKLAHREFLSDQPLHPGGWVLEGSAALTPPVLEAVMTLDSPPTPPTSDPPAPPKP